MKTICTFICMSFLTIIAWSPPKGKLELDTETRHQIEKVMSKQEEDWSNGDIDAYMEGYWKSDSLKFISKNGVTYGWGKTLAKYQNAYPDKASMGKLKFEIRSMELICFKTVLVIGKWTLERTEGLLEGYYSLIWKRIDGKWVIVIDHTS